MHRRQLLSTLALAVAWPALSSTRALAETPAIRFRELYVRGNELTEKAKALEGAQVNMVGYMAPPLKPEIDFFVLTKLPMSTCPFCESEAQWPDDLVLALTKEPISVVRYTDLIRVTGRFETGFEKDEATGFVSFVRLIDVDYVKL